MRIKFLLMLLAIALVAGVAQANLLKNPGFEEGTFAAQGVPDDWEKSWASYYSAWTWFDDTDAAHWGSRYIKMVSFVVDSSSAWIEQTVDVTGGQEYAFSVWAKCPDEDEISEAWAWVDWLDSESTRIGGGWLPWGWDAGDDWTHGEFGTATAPESATRGIFYLSGVLENGPMGVLFDDAYMGIPLPTFPSPAWESFVPVGDVDLSWTNLVLDPNDSVYVKVLFGTEPNETQPAYNMEPLTLDPVSGQDVTSATVEDLAEGTYYWQVKSYLEGDPAEVDYDTGDPNNPNSTKGHVWSFTTATDLPPSVTINTPDMITWHNEPVQLDATVIDIGEAPVLIEWTVSFAGTTVTGVTFEPNEFVEDPAVSIDRGYYSNANIVNPSFEDGLTGWDGRGGTWTGTYGTKKYIVASDGYLLAYTWDTGTDNNGLSQTLTETFAADTTYTLTVDVANDGYYNEQVDYRVQLLAGGSILAEDNNEQHLLPIPSGGGTAKWYTSVVVYTCGGESDPNFAYVGKPLEIRLLAINDTWEMSFDNVHLTSDPAFPVPPGTTYELTVTATDDLGSDSATVGIDVYYTACQAARIGFSLAAENPGDMNADCDTDLYDLDALATTWLDEPDGLPTDAVIGSAGTAGGQYILSTDFTDRIVTGPTASNITWIANGVSDPGDLTAVDIDSAAPAPFELFDNANAADRFIPNLNILNEGPWSATITLNLTLPTITLEDVVLDYQHLGNAGVIPTVDKDGKLTVSVTGSVSGLLDSVAISHEVLADDGSGSDTFMFSSPLTLTDSESYDFTILAESVSTGANVGLETLTLRGIFDPLAPTVDAGPDWITWSGEPVIMDPYVVNNDPLLPPLTHVWTADPDTGVVITEDGINPDDTATPGAVVVITKDTDDPSVVVLTLTVTRPGSPPISSTMRIDVYDDACKMGLAIGMAVEYDPSDVNLDCFTDIKDFAAMAKTWLDDYDTLTAPVEKP